MESTEIEIITGDRPGIHDLTPECISFLADAAGQSDGLLNVFVPHATAGTVIMELGSGSDDDLLGALERLLPPDDRWRHRHGVPGHGADHVLPALLAPSVTIPVIAGRMALGTWQSVALIDTNRSNRSRRVRLSFLAG
ncbi:MAG: secondary thiamine-phosphate synthase enzyme YjbQ [Chloroflexota bacterium]